MFLCFDKQIACLWHRCTEFHLLRFHRNQNLLSYVIDSCVDRLNLNLHLSGESHLFSGQNESSSNIPTAEFALSEKIFLINICSKLLLPNRKSTWAENLEKGFVSTRGLHRRGLNVFSRLPRKFDRKCKRKCKWKFPSHKNTRKLGIKIWFPRLYPKYSSEEFLQGILFVLAFESREIYKNVKNGIRVHHRKLLSHVMILIQ